MTGLRSPRLLTIGLFGVMVAAGCAHRNLKPDDMPTPGRAYFYGRLHIDVPKTALGRETAQTIGFVLRCDDGSEYLIRFVRDNRVQVVAAKPGRCALVDVAFIDGHGTIRKYREAWGDPPGGFLLAADTAYYLGDYFADATSESKWGVFFTETTSRWELTSEDDNYEATTAEMKRTFANLAELPTENRMLLRRKHRPGDARKHQGGGGGGPNDTVSPERAARLAAFIKRRYATPTECEAACPQNGDCFPFRSDEGTAMTCVIRCQTDKHCPEGLACNCPSGDGAGAACRAIAGAPDDPMEGICLSVEPAGERR